MSEEIANVSEEFKEEFRQLVHRVCHEGKISQETVDEWLSDDEIDDRALWYYGLTKQSDEDKNALLEALGMNEIETLPDSSTQTGTAFYESFSAQNVIIFEACKNSK